MVLRRVLHGARVHFAIEQPDGCRVLLPAWTLAAMAEARRWVLKEDVRTLLDRAMKIPPGYAGFQAAACLTVAESLALCGQDARVGAALDEALRAAHNVQDLVFCARSVSRVHALRVHWWPTAKNDEVAIVDVIARFVRDPHAPEFAALHLVGEHYSDRVAGLMEACTLKELARAYQWPLADWMRCNPGIPVPDAELPKTDPKDPERGVRVPDPRFSALLAAYFASRVLASPALKPAERVSLILKLVPVAVTNRTALDTVLSRLVLAAPVEAKALDEIDTALASYPLPMVGEVAGPEPMA
jgi:hypothetical protein